MFVTVINTLAIVGGSLLGLGFRKYMKKEIFETVMKIMGLTTIVISLASILKALIIINAENKMEIPDEMILAFILCTVIGTFIGEVLRIENGINRFGLFVEKKINKDGFSKGFVFATIIYCVGAMSIIGSINAAMGDPSILYMKAILDGISSIILASTLGYGVLFSAISVLIYQGTITFIGQYLSAPIQNSPVFLNLFTIVGYVIVLAIGINFIFKDRFKVANMLPSLLLVIIYAVIRSFI